MQPQQQPIEGYLGFFGLGDWWLRTFTPAEREYIEQRYHPLGMPPNTRPLTQGHVSELYQPASSMLSGLESWFRRADDATIVGHIHAKVVELGQTRPITGPGYYQGRHFTTYGEEVRSLKHSDDTSPALENLLLNVIAAVEAEAHARQWPVAPAYYEELGILYRKRKDYAAELAIIERYKHQPHGGNFPDDIVLKREAKARELLSRASQEPQT